MREFIFYMFLAILIIFSSFTSGFYFQTKTIENSNYTPPEVKLRIEGVDAVKVSNAEDGIVRTMEVENRTGELSNLTFISKDQAYVKIFSNLSVTDATNLWNDLCIIENETDIRDVHIFINSAGGDAFSGMALADQIERAKKNKFNISAHASGIVASAAVPVFAVCSRRLAAPGTIFMVHEASLWKWPGRETASDIKAQNDLMAPLRDRYLKKLSLNSKKSASFWGDMKKKTTWFSAAKALEWGLVDEIR